MFWTINKNIKKNYPDPNYIFDHLNHVFISNLQAWLTGLIGNIANISVLTEGLFASIVCTDVKRRKQMVYSH